MNNVAYIREQNNVVRFYIEMVCVVTIITTLIFLGTYKIDATVEVEPLSDSQQIQLVEMLTLQGFKETFKNGCYSVIVEKIQNDTWSNNWCATQYKHLKLNGVK